MYLEDCFKQRQGILSANYLCTAKYLCKVPVQSTCVLQRRRKVKCGVSGARSAAPSSSARTDHDSAEFHNVTDGGYFHCLIYPCQTMAGKWGKFSWGDLLCVKDLTL